MSDSKEIREELGQTVHKIWLAGLGALSSAGEEGTKLFNTLVEKGEVYEKQGKERLDEVKTKVEEAAGSARDRAGSTVGKVESKIDEAVSSAFARLGVPSREEIATLTKRVEELTAVVEKLKPAAASSTKKAAAKS